jgi:hypothetical protein
MAVYELRNLTDIRGAILHQSSIRYPFHLQYFLFKMLKDLTLLQLLGFALKVTKKNLS